MKILIGTDFSSHSMIALNYAVELANILNAELHLITAYQLITDVDTQTLLDKETQNDMEQRIKSVASGIIPLLTNDKRLSIEVLKGNPVECIVEYAENQNIDLIIIGTQGNRSLANVLFGSTSKKIIEHTKIPVLVIPNIKYDKHFSGRFLIALDDKPLDNENEFGIINKIAETADMAIDILHVSKKGESKFPIDPSALNYIGDKYRDFYNTNNSNILKGINEFMYGEPSYKCLVMVKRKKGFFDRLFEREYTFNEVSISKIPLLIIHE